LDRTQEIWEKEICQVERQRTQETLMPFKSKRQIRWMFANKPALAAQWEDKYGLKIGKKKAKRKKRR
jgi:glycerol kinase